jgi:hypothetical protein
MNIQVTQSRVVIMGLIHFTHRGCRWLRYSDSSEDLLISSSKRLYHPSCLNFSRTASHVSLWQLAAPERSLTGDTPACCPELVFLIILGRNESTANSNIPDSSVKRGFLGLDAWFDELPSVRYSSLLALFGRSRPAYDICPSKNTSQPMNFTGQDAC